MTTVTTRKTRLGNLVKGEFWREHGYERENRSITIVAATAEIGQVYAADGTIVIAADVAAIAGTDISILIDDDVYTDGLGDGTREYTVLSGGPGASGGAVVVREQLKFGDALTSGQIDTVVTALNTKGIKVGTQI